MDALVCTAGDGVRCAARVAGRTGETILFVHDVGSTAEIWDPQLSALSERFRCAAVELRGNGVAPLPNSLAAISREGFARDCTAIADALDAQDLHFVGCGLGGVVGLELWRREPHRLSSLSLLDSFAAYPDGASAAAGIVDAVLTAPSIVTFAEEQTNRLLPPGASSHRRTESVRQIASMDRRAYARFLSATLMGDYRALLGSIAIPALVLHGEHDTLVPRSLCEELIAKIPRALFVEVPDAGHICNADAPTFVNAVLEAFIASIPNHPS